MNNHTNANAHLKPRKSDGNSTQTREKTHTKVPTPDHVHDPAKSKSATLSTQILLTIVALAMFLSIQNFFGKAVFEKVRGYKQEFRSGLGSIPKDSLMGSRFGLDYLLPNYLVKTMRPESPILLVPPISYTKKLITQQAAHSLTNPIYMFYMNPDIKTVTMDSPDLEKANCAILIDKEGRCYPMMISNKEQLKLALIHFSKGEPYNPTIQ